MNKGVIIGLVGLGGLGLFLMVKKTGGMGMLKGTLKAPPPANSPGSASRADTASQPWYNQGVAFLKTKVGNEMDSIKKNPTAALQNFGSVIRSLGDITGIFQSGENDTGSAAAGDMSGPDDATASADLARLGPITDMPSSTVDQSDMIGSQLGGDTSGSFTTADNSMMVMNDPGGDIGSSNADFSAA